MLLDLLLGLLPYLSLFLTITYVLQKNTLQDAIVQASLIWGGFIFLLSLGLSLLNTINYVSMLGAFGIYCLLMFKLSWAKRSCINIKCELNNYFKFILFIVIIVIITGLIYPPNTWDALTYHMPRIQHWIQNQNQSFFYTNIIRQNGMAPFASTMILPSVILSKSDIYANLMQGLAFAGSIYLILCIAKELKASRAQQWLAALFFATLPMAILQASSVQTDIAITYWFLCFVYMFLQWKKQRLISQASYSGLALGLAILTKGTAYVIGLPFVIYFAYLLLKDLKKYFWHATIICLLVVVINVPHLVRNYNFYGSIIAAGENTIVQKPSIGTFIANFVGNLRVHDPGLVLKEEFDNIYYNMCSLLGVDVEDKAIFPWGHERYSLKMEDSKAQNSLHALALCIIFLLFFMRKLSLPRAYTWLTLSVVASFCLLIAWQPWITRLQTPIFALCAPIFGFALGSMELNKSKVLRTFIFLMCFTALVPLLMNVLRPIIPYYAGYPSIWNSKREELYFVKLPQLKDNYIAAASALAKEKPQEIALLLGEDSVEYPIWSLLQNRMNKLPYMYHSFNEQLQNEPAPYVFALSLQAIGTEDVQVNSVTQALRHKLFGEFKTKPSVTVNNMPAVQDLMPQGFKLIEDKYIPLQ